MWLRAGVTPLKKNRIRRNCFAGSLMSEQVGLVSLFVPALDRGKMGSYLNSESFREQAIQYLFSTAVKSR